MDSQPYVQLAKGCLILFDTAFKGYRVQRGLYTILGKTSYTLIRLTNHPFLILYTIQKTSYTVT